jgi:hypothetical protein
MINFTDKIERIKQLKTAETQWSDGRRFFFTDKYGPILVGTERSDYCDICWKCDTMKGETAIEVHSGLAYDDTSPIHSMQKEWYDIEKLPEAFNWIAKNTV